MVTSVERERSDEFRLLPPPPSQEIEKTYQEFERLGGIEVERMREEAREIVKVIFDFADYNDGKLDNGKEKKGLISSVYEAAYLMPIMKMQSSVDPMQKYAAEHAIKAYNSENSLDPQYLQDRKYVRTIGRDTVEIDTFLDGQFDAREVLAIQEKKRKKNKKPDPAARKYQNPYLKQYKKKPFEDALELVADEPEEGIDEPKGVNLESVVLSAASAYYNLRHSDDLNFPEDTVLKTIYAAETFYQPVLDIISYGAFGSMAFKREVSLIRLSRNGGKYGDLDYEKLGIAREMLSKLPTRKEMPGVIADLLASLTGRHAEASSVLRDTSDHGVQFIAGSINHMISEYPDLEEFTDFDFEQDIQIKDTYIGIRARVQTDVKAAGKITIKKEIDKEGNKIVVKVKHGADLVGALLIFKNVDLLLDTYERVAGKVNDFEGGVAPKNSRSKNTPRHIAGKGLIQLVEKEIGSIIGDIDTRVTQNGYQAAKLTFTYTPDGTDFPIPIELAFQTEADRFEARVGEASHAFQDEEYEVSRPDTLHASKGLHVRRGRLNEAGLTTVSEIRGQEFYEGLIEKENDQKKRIIGSKGIKSFLLSDRGGVL